MTYTYYPSMEGQAFIATRKNRIKVYPGNQVFLQDKQEFEIELFNPSQTTKLARISINGKQISTSGLVLKPGQRVYLERYIDNPRKFLFETYSVEGSSAEVQAAIQKNGDIEISFYDEQELYQKPLDITWTYTNNGTGNFDYKSERLCNDLLNRQNFKSNHSNDAGLNFMGTATSSSACYSTNTDGLLRSASVKKSIVKETGRVEQGGHSQQSFTNYSGDFKSYATNTVRIKLLPYSEKPLEISDLAVYCTICATKRKSGWIFCPNCSTQF